MTSLQRRLERLSDEWNARVERFGDRGATRSDNLSEESRATLHAIGYFLDVKCPRTQWLRQQILTRAFTFCACGRGLLPEGDVICNWCVHDEPERWRENRKARLNVTLKEQYGEDVTNIGQVTSVKRKIEKSWRKHDRKEVSDRVQKTIRARRGGLHHRSTQESLDKYRATMMERHGVDNGFNMKSARRAAARGLYLVNQVEYKGKVYGVQGYEDLALQYLLKRTTKRNLVSQFDEEFEPVAFPGNRVGTYTPDFYLKDRDLYVEMKGEMIYKFKSDWQNTKRKAQYGKRTGTFRLTLLYGLRLTGGMFAVIAFPSGWSDWTHAQARAFIDKQRSHTFGEVYTRLRSLVREVG